MWDKPEPYSTLELWIYQGRRWGNQLTDEERESLYIALVPKRYLDVQNTETIDKDSE